MKSDQAALDNFAARRAEARKRVFGAPINWEKVIADEQIKRLDPNPKPAKAMNKDDGHET